MFCSRCGAQLNEGSVFCSRCGGRVSLVTEQVQPMGDVSPKSRLATSLLAIFLGCVGAHRFYTGKIGTAVIMLLVGVAALICQLAATFVAITESDEIDVPLLYLLFLGLCLVFSAVVGIWALIDFIIAVTGNFKDREGKIIKRW